MLLIPAIDIKDGRCVRLVQGSMLDATVYSEDPVSQADRWVEAGAERIHIVDLNGAVQGTPVNADIVGIIAGRHSNVEVQVGGGIRNLETAARYFDAGVTFVILGTQAVNDPSFIGQINAHYPASVIAGIDVRGGAAATEGWSGSGRSDIVSLAKELEQYGACAIVYTDIERDGMLSGVNVRATAFLASQISIPVIASGGIRDMEDIHNLLEAGSKGIMGAIAGKSLYEGTLDYAQALKLITDFKQHAAQVNN